MYRNLTLGVDWLGATERDWEHMIGCWFKLIYMPLRSSTTADYIYLCLGPVGPNWHITWCITCASYTVKMAITMRTKINLEAEPLLVWHILQGIFKWKRKDKNKWYKFLQVCSVRNLNLCCNQPIRPPLFLIHNVGLPLRTQDVLVNAFLYFL